MARFGSRSQNPVDAHERALNEEIARLEREIASLSNAHRKSKPAKLDGSSPRALKGGQSSIGESPQGGSSVSSKGSGSVLGAAGETIIVPLPLPPSGPVDLKPMVPASEGAGAAKSPANRISDVPVDPRFNELGVRKFDLLAWWRSLLAKIQHHTMGPTSNNPHMIRYLATGSVHGLRPLRYERRVARNRLLALVAALIFVLYGLAWVFLRNNPR